ncbi:hypothetical protein Tco_1197062 [Tanacetum coccineum]
MSFSKRSDIGPVCYTKPLDSLKHYNFFWVDAFAFPLSIPWHNNKTLKKDPHPTPTEFNAEVCDFLATHPAPFWKFLESFVCLVGISRYYELDDNVYMVFLADDDEGGDGFVCFINHADPTKVRIRERKVREGEVLLLESTRGRVVPLASVNEQGNQNDDIQDAGVHVVNEEGATNGQENLVDADIVRIEDEVPATVAEKAKGSRKKRKAAGGASGFNLPPKKLRADHGTSGAGASTSGKSVVVLQGLLERSTLHVEVGVTVRTQHPTERFVVLSDSPCHYSSNATNAEVSSVIRSLVSDRPIMTTAVATTVVVAASFVMVPRAGDEPVYASIFTDSTSAGTDMDSETLRPIYVPKWNMVNEFSFDDPDVCRSLIDQLSPHVLFSQLCGMDYGQLFAEFNVRAARQTCLGAEVRIRTEHILMEKRKLEGRCSRQAEAAEAIRLRGQFSVAEAMEAARVAELNSLKERTTALEGQVAALESAAIILDTELASSNAQITKLTQDLSNFQLSCDELSVKATSLES